MRRFADDSVYWEINKRCSIRPIGESPNGRSGTSSTTGDTAWDRPNREATALRLNDGASRGEERDFGRGTKSGLAAGLSRT